MALKTVKQSTRRVRRPSAERSAETSSAQPLYARVHEALRRGIAEGSWSPGERLPTEAELCRQFGVSRITVRHALQLLREEGAIATHSARPALVMSRGRTAVSSDRLDTLEDLIAGAGGAALAIRTWKMESRRDAARIFGLLSATEMPCLRSILMREGQPFARSLIYFRPDIGARLERSSFNDTIVFRVMQRELGIVIRDVKMTASAEAATATDAAELGVAQGAPMLISRLVFRTDLDAPVQISYTRYPADAWQFTHTLDLPSLD